MLYRLGVPLAPLTTLRVGGAASRMVTALREEDVEDALHDAGARREPVFVLGGGSNVVVGDAGFDGLVLRMGIKGVEVRSEGDRVVVHAAAGEDWDAFVARGVDEGWSGIACLSGIPGLVGATPIQNVGAYGTEVESVIASVRVFDRDDNGYRDRKPAACGFGYRASVFKHNTRWIVTQVRFSFARSDVETVRYAELARALGVPEGGVAPVARVREAVLALRRSKGMVLDAADPESVSAGSFFTNPIVDAAAAARVEVAAGKKPPTFPVGDGKVKLAAGWLVEQAGFEKGWTLGRAGVSRKHALALVNRGGATASEILVAARAIRDGVQARLGVTLEPEPVLVGCGW